MADLRINELCVEYGKGPGVVRALDSFSLQVPEGEMAVLLGPSGCGKSSALNSVAGLVSPSGGQVSIGNRVVFDAGKKSASIDVAPNHRGIAMVFQSYALWPHMRVQDNVAYPLRRQGISRTEVSERVAQSLRLVHCEDLGRRYPRELSGGQQQRIALARALTAEADLLLFDEPLSNLDAGLRRRLRDELARLHRQLGFTGIYVTHDQTEALALGTFIVLMNTGEIVQQGSPRDMYERPMSPYAARFFGAQIVRGTIIEGAGGNGHGRVRLPFGVLDSARVAESARTAQGVDVALFPDRIGVVADEEGQGTVETIAYLGSREQVTIEADGVTLEVLLSARDQQLNPGARVRLIADPLDVHVFAQDPELQLSQEDEADLPGP